MGFFKKKKFLLGHIYLFFLSFSLYSQMTLLYEGITNFIIKQ